MRTGIGMDAHRFEPGRKLVLGGVHVEGHDGLAGHSDADVLAHAVMDALLGAAGMDDIGLVFPDTDPRYAGASSIELLGAVRARLESGGFRVVNVDAVVVCERPRISPYRGRMCDRIAGALGIGAGDVSVKGTTTEGMGFTGRGEGIACIACVLLADAAD